jgi:hypothetical protein
LHCFIQVGSVNTDYLRRVEFNFGAKNFILFYFLDGKSPSVDLAVLGSSELPTGSDQRQPVDVSGIFLCERCCRNVATLKFRSMVHINKSVILYFMDFIVHNSFALLP